MIGLTNAQRTRIAHTADIRMAGISDQTIKRRAARLGIRPDDLADACQNVRIALLTERPDASSVNAVISRRLIDFARREYGNGKERGRQNGYRSAHGLDDCADYDATNTVGQQIYHHVNATADHADRVAARVDMAELIRRADGRLSPNMFHVLIADVQEKTPAEIRAALGVTAGRVQQIRNRAYEIIRSVA